MCKPQGYINISDISHDLKRLPLCAEISSFSMAWSALALSAEINKDVTMPNKID